MQERIHETPPTIKIFEGAPPPTHWVNENIVKYLENQHKIAFLKNVVSYLQQLQSEKLLEARPRAVAPLQERLAPLPQKGSALEIANTITYNATQGHLKNELVFLEKLIAIIKEGNPNNPEINRLSDQLKTTIQSFPALSSQQVQNLSSLMEEATHFAGKSSSLTQRAFFNTQLHMMQTLMTNNNATIKEAQEEAKDLQGRIKMLERLEGILQNVNHSLKSSPPQPEQFLELIENLQNLANSHGLLNLDQQQALMHYFQHLNQFKNSVGQGLIEVAADGLIQAKMVQFSKNNPQATSAEITQHLRLFLQESNLQSSPLSFMKNLGQAIENVINRPKFPAVDGLSGLPFNEKEGTKLVPSEKMLSALLAVFSPAPNSLKSMENATQHLLATLSSEKEQIEIAAHGYQMAAQNLKITQEHFGQAAAWGVGKAVGAGQPLKGASAPIVGEPLPSQFAHVIIDHFMPQQEQFLQNLAMLLFLNNMGAQFGNSLLDKMLGFGDAANNYNFNHYLRPAGDGNFSGSVADAIKQLQAEERQCAQDMKQNNEIAATITRQLAQIKQELDKQPPPTPKQKAILTKMQASLTSTLQSSNACYDQLHNLAHLLSTLKISAAPGISPDKEFTITSSDPTWQTDLGQDESDVINGNPKQIPSGGLVKLQSQTQAFQQSYADQGQNLQMQLQMEMTGIQQEWTVVSTALQLLNQMYMSVAQAIYKG